MKLGYVELDWYADFLQSESSEIIFACVCTKKFATNQKIKEHVEAVHGGDRYYCSAFPKIGIYPWLTRFAADKAHIEDSFSMPRKRVSMMYDK